MVGISATLSVGDATLGGRASLGDANPRVR